MKIIFKKIGKFLISVGILGLVPVVLFVFITSRSPILFGIRSFVVVTGSMVPKLPIGSMVFTFPATSYDIGDIITFKRQNISVTHRIAVIKNDVFQTKGDANNAADPEWVSKTNVIGKDIVIMPSFLGKFTELLKTAPGFIIFLGIPTFIFLIFEGREFKHEYDKGMEEKILKKMNGFERL